MTPPVSTPAVSTPVSTPAVSTPPVSTPAVEFRDVDILFAQGLRRASASQDRALALMDAGGSRAEIAAATGVVLGVRGASLSVAQGEISVLMGLSGSGKSTLLRAANGLNRVTRGAVLLRDGDAAVDLARCDRATLRRLRLTRVAMVFQQFALLPWRSVRENVALGLELRGMDRAQRLRMADEKLQLVGLDGWGDRQAHELSGGMQQRVGLARAFATDADVLLMDEPFSALDPLIRGKLQDELLALQRAVRKTILFVSHDLDEALKLGNHITIMEGGRIVQTGTPEDIVLHPADDYVAEFVRHMNPLTALLGSHVMRRAADLDGDGAGLWLDPARRYRLMADGEGRPLRVLVDGVAHPVVAQAADAPSAPGEMAVIPADTRLRGIIGLQQASGHPVLLAEDGRFVGVCCEGEILRALCEGGARSDAALTAPAMI